MTQKYTAHKLDFAASLDFSEILTNPILDIAARFWEDDRYRAFQVCYRSMRRIDDLIDDRKAGGERLTVEEIREYKQSIEGWLKVARAGQSTNAFMDEFLEVVRRYHIPLWPWERLCRAMIYDLEHDGFASLPTFLRYTEGAAIAPASVFTHLCGISYDNDRVVPPPYDIRRAARPLAVFSYLVHILRDFEKDQKARLNYFADSMMSESGVVTDDLIEIADGGQPTSAFRTLVRRYCEIAEYYRRKARQTLGWLLPQLAPRYQLSLEVIYGLYLQIFERIDPAGGSFTTSATNPEPAQVQERIKDIVGAFVPAS